MSLVGVIQNDVANEVTALESAIFGPSVNVISGPSTASALGVGATASPVVIVLGVGVVILLLKWLKVL